MTVDEAVSILRAHNEWRRGNKTENWGPMPYSPAQIGGAIDVVCNWISARAAVVESERDAARFKHLVANGVGWSDGSPHLTRRDSALRDIDKTRAEIDKAMAAQEKAKQQKEGE